MQYWVFFVGGVGGDGFSNFLEHANNITPVDDWNSRWRIDKKGSGYSFNPSTTKFLMPHWNSNFWLFRGPTILFNLDRVELAPFYKHLVATGKNTVIPCHPRPYFEQIDSFRYKDIIMKDQIKIFLTTSNYYRVLKDYTEKCPTDAKEGQPNTAEWLALYRKCLVEDIEAETASGRYEYIIDIDRIWDSWEYTNSVLTEIGIDMSRDRYEEYLDVSKRRK